MPDVKEANLKAAKGGGVTSKEEPNIPHDVFNTSGNQPVRDRTADPSKGTPVVRYFTKDGTPVEPATIPMTKFDQEPNLEARPDVMTVVEYEDEDGNPVTHDSLKAKDLKAKQEDKENSNA